MVQTKNPSPVYKPPMVNKKFCVLKRKPSSIVKPVTRIYHTSPTKLPPKSPGLSPRKLTNPFKKNVTTTPAKKLELNMFHQGRQHFEVQKSSEYWIHQNQAKLFLMLLN
jgi:hypothetical protein